MRGRLNLASRRSRNERLPVLGFSLLCLVLLVASGEHALVIRRLLPGQSSALHHEVVSLEAEEASLRKEAADLRGGPPPEKARVEEWLQVKELVDRRVFRWTQLFARLARTLPPELRLTGITPAVTKGNVTLDLEAAVKSIEAGLAFVKTLEDQPEFKDVYPDSVADVANSSEKTFKYVMVYLPDAGVDSGAPTASAKGAGK